MIGGLRPYPSYRESGVSWTARVPSHWKTERAQWLFTKTNRPTGPEDDVVTCFRDGRVTLRKNRRLRGFTETIFEFGYQGIRKGDLVIHAMDAFAGAVGVSDSDGKGTPVYAVCQPNPGICAHYYAHIVREMARSQWILAIARGIRERSTDFRYDAFRVQPLPVPPLEEQNAIVRCLVHVNWRLERAIRAKKKLITLLNEQRQAIIQRAVTRGLGPHVRFKPSGIPWLGDIPAHWSVSRLKFEASHIVDCLHATPRYSEDGQFPAIRTADIEPGKVRLETARHVSREHYALWTSRLAPQEGDILYSREGERYGIAALVPAGIHLCISQRMMVFRIRPPQRSPFLMWQLNCPHVYSQAAADTIGATSPHVNVERIRNFLLVLPPPQEQHEISTWISTHTVLLDAAIARAHREIDLVREYRARLTAAIVTGQLDIRDVAMSFPSEIEESEVAAETDDDTEELLEAVADDE